MAPLYRAVRALGHGSDVRSTQPRALRLRRRLREAPDAGWAGAGATSADGLALPAGFAAHPVCRAARTSACEGQGRASPAAQAGGSPFDHFPISSNAIITI